MRDLPLIGSRCPGQLRKKNLNRIDKSQRNANASLPYKNDLWWDKRPRVVHFVSQFTSPPHWVITFDTFSIEVHWSAVQASWYIQNMFLTPSSMTQKGSFDKSESR